ncbi:MAG: ferritin-like domain-containing protein [Rhizobiaceae bacterium]|nr:ferritin-like domain-containing protein [Rhizobiaceae bacterium]
MIKRPESLISGAHSALLASDLDEKVELTQLTATLWRQRTLSFSTGSIEKPPVRPGRPQKPDLLPPAQVPKRPLKSKRGRLALIHAIAHIELNAIDLALDIIVRFAREPMPRSFFDGWMKVADEEAKHFSLLRKRLQIEDHDYGDLPAHDGLWEAAGETGHDLTARLAIVPLVLEARGLDVTPPLVTKLRAFGDNETADIFEIIYEDEKGHVAVGAKWFRFLCQRQGLEPAATFSKLVSKYFRGSLKPPFNNQARSASGLTPLFYRSLSPLGN